METAASPAPASPRDRFAHARERLDRQWRGAPMWQKGLVVLLIAIVILIAVWDWNWFKGPIERRVEAATGREFAIEGDLDVDLDWTRPVVIANDVMLGNAGWTTSGPVPASHAPSAGACISSQSASPTPRPAGRSRQRQPSSAGLRRPGPNRIASCTRPMPAEATSVTDTQPPLACCSATSGASGNHADTNHSAEPTVHAASSQTARAGVAVADRSSGMRRSMPTPRARRPFRQSVGLPAESGQVSNRSASSRIRFAAPLRIAAACACVRGRMRAK